MKAKGHRHRLDPYFEQQRAAKKWALRVGNRITYEDGRGRLRGTVTRVNPDGTAEVELDQLNENGLTVKRDKPTIISQAKRAPGKYRTGMMVGFYGCKGVLVRVSWTRTKPNQPGPRAVIIPECPACKHRHGATRFMWRKAHSEEEFNSAMVAL